MKKLETNLIEMTSLQVLLVMNTNGGPELFATTRTLPSAPAVSPRASAEA